MRGQILQKLAEKNECKLKKIIKLYNYYFYTIYLKQEADIPIDIHTLKLQDWLISRRIVPKNIQTALKDIHSKISNALQDMPSNDELIKLLKGSSEY